MAKEKPKPLPVFIESFTGLSPKLEFVQALYEAIINVAWDNGIELDWIKIEAEYARVKVGVLAGQIVARRILDGRHLLEYSARKQDGMFHDFAYELIMSVKEVTGGK